MTTSTDRTDDMNESNSNPEIPEYVDKISSQSTFHHVLQKTIDRLTTLGDIRDGILISGAVFYVTGYTVWSLHAWRHSR